jgi:hypothetical protein
VGGSSLSNVELGTMPCSSTPLLAEVTLLATDADGVCPRLLQRGRENKRVAVIVVAVVVSAKPAGDPSAPSE